MSGTVEPSVTVKPFGKTEDGQQVQQYTLTGAGGVVMDVIDYGGKVVRLYTPDRSGQKKDITLWGSTTCPLMNADPYSATLIAATSNRSPTGVSSWTARPITLPTNNTPGVISHVRCTAETAALTPMSGRANR
jgi:aldose 1-epimerase